VGQFGPVGTLNVRGPLPLNQTQGGLAHDEDRSCRGDRRSGADDCDSHLKGYCALKVDASPRVTHMGNF
jgi:hypothetical protein